VIEGLKKKLSFRRKQKGKKVWN